jgi:hypothetical protein
MARIENEDDLYEVIAQDDTSAIAGNLRSRSTKSPLR